MLASLGIDPQVAAAALAAEDDAARQLGACKEKLSLLAYSDGSVIADGVEGSAAVIVLVALMCAPRFGSRLRTVLSRRGALSGRGCF